MPSAIVIKKFRYFCVELVYRLAKKDKNKEWRPNLRVEASMDTTCLR